MDNTDSAQNSGNTVFKHIFRFDDETKTKLMNLTQYTLLAILPIAIIQNVTDHLFPDYDKSKGTVELLAEISGQTLLTVVCLLFIHRVITAIPTFSGIAMGDLDFFNIIISLLLASFMFDNRLKKKMNTVINRLIEVWDGKPKEERSQKKPSGVQPVVSISQPISRGGAPTHQVSQADYIGMHAGMNAPQPPSPPPAVQTQHVSDQSQIPAGQQMAPMMQEPAAANGFGGGFATF